MTRKEIGLGLRTLRTGSGLGKVTIATIDNDTYDDK